jgi:hypothetical protein
LRLFLVDCHTFLVLGARSVAVHTSETTDNNAKKPQRIPSIVERKPDPVKAAAKDLLPRTLVKGEQIVAGNEFGEYPIRELYQKMLKHGRKVEYDEIEVSTVPNIRE